MMHQRCSNHDPTLMLRPVELLHRALPGLRREVGVTHGHFDGGVAHQLLDDLERDAPHGEVAAVGVPQVVPGRLVTTLECLLLFSLPLRP